MRARKNSRFRLLTEQRVWTSYDADESLHHASFLVRPVALAAGCTIASAMFCMVKATVELRVLTTESTSLLSGQLPKTKSESHPTSRRRPLPQKTRPMWTSPETLRPIVLSCALPLHQFALFACVTEQHFWSEDQFYVDLHEHPVADMT